MVDERALIVGVPLGEAFGIIELFILFRFRKIFIRRSFIITILIKAIIYLIFINLITGILTTIYVLSQSIAIDDFLSPFIIKKQIILNIYALTLSTFILCSDKFTVGRWCVI